MLFYCYHDINVVANNLSDTIAKFSVVSLRHFVPLISGLKLSVLTPTWCLACCPAFIEQHIKNSGQIDDCKHVIAKKKKY